MPNEQNLIPNSQRSPNELRENGRKGGQASGKSRSLRAAVKRRLKENPDLIDAICEKLETMILDDGNLSALSFLLELSGESARQMEINLKKDELKLKKEIAEMQNW